MTHKKTNFRDKIGRNIKTQKENRKGFGYLNLPSGITVLELDKDTTKFELDFLPYEVTDDAHPDKDTQADIAVKGSLWYRRPFKVHRNVGSNNDSVVCPRSFGHPCPICDYQKKRIKDGADKEEFKLLYPKPRSLYIVRIPGEEDIHVWDMSDKLFQEVLNETLQEEQDAMCFPDLEEGKTLEIRIKWKELGDNTFPEVRNIEFNNRKPIDESILEEVPNLDQMLKVLSYKEIEAKFFETDTEEDAGKLEDVKEETPVVERKQKTIEKEEKKKEEPAPAEPARRVREQKTEDSRCPFKHRYGTDFDKFKDCDTCDKWDGCMDESKQK